MRRGLSTILWAACGAILLTTGLSCHVFDESDPATGQQAGAAAGAPASLAIYLSSLETDTAFNPITFAQDELTRRSGLNQCFRSGGTGENALNVIECQDASVGGGGTPGPGPVVGMRVKLSKLTIERVLNDPAPLEFVFDPATTPTIDLIASLHSPQLAATVELPPGEYVSIAAELTVLDYDVAQASQERFWCDTTCNFSCQNRPCAGRGTRRSCLRTVCYEAHCTPSPGTETLVIGPLANDFTRLIVDGSHGFARVIEVEADASCSQPKPIGPPDDPFLIENTVDPPGEGIINVQNSSQIIPLGPFG